MQYADMLLLTHLWHTCRGTERISDRNNELHRLGAALEEAKAQLDSRGSSLADASPLVRIKAAISSLKEELGAMEVRIGVVAHSLLCFSLRDKQAAMRDVAAAAAAGGGVARAGKSPDRQKQVRAGRL
jgi:estrogen-related receptor beta like 1